MLYGMFTKQDNERRLEALEKAIAKARRAGDYDAVSEMEADRREMLAWFSDVARIDP